MTDTTQSAANTQAATHTPGEWSAGGHGSIVGADGSRVCTVSFDGKAPSRMGEEFANGRLIAAAPDMLAALKEFVARVDAGEIRSKKTYAAFKAIIAKAEPQAQGEG